MKKMLGLITFLFMSPVFADNCPDPLAYEVISMAWPSAQYERCQNYRVRQSIDDPQSVIYSVRAIGLLSGKEVWVDAAVTLGKGTNFTNVRWLGHSGPTPIGEPSVERVQKAWGK